MLVLCVGVNVSFREQKVVRWHTAEVLANKALFNNGNYPNENNHVHLSRSPTPSRVVGGDAVDLHVALHLHRVHVAQVIASGERSEVLAVQVDLKLE